MSKQDLVRKLEESRDWYFANLIRLKGTEYEGRATIRYQRAVERLARNR